MQRFCKSLSIRRLGIKAERYNFFRSDSQRVTQIFKNNKNKSLLFQIKALFLHRLINKNVTTMRNQDYYQRRETANLIGLDCAVLPLLSELYYNNRLPESAIDTCAYTLNAYREARSNFMRNIYRNVMEQIYFIL